jgi:hypothetical protein
VARSKLKFHFYRTGVSVLNAMGESKRVPWISELTLYRRSFATCKQQRIVAIGRRA